MIPKPKTARIEDKDTLEWVKNGRDGCCLYGLLAASPCNGELGVHHIKSVGSGGDDTPENLITLCQDHHNKAQEGKIKAAELRRILSHYFGYIYQEA